MLFCFQKVSPTKALYHMSVVAVRLCEAGLFVYCSSNSLLVVKHITADYGNTRYTTVLRHAMLYSQSQFVRSQHWGGVGVKSVKLL